MCGRFALDVHGDTVFASFDWLDGARSDQKLTTQWMPKRNVTPTNESLVVGQRPNTNPTLRNMRWGLQNTFRSKVRNHINARVETLNTRPAFQRAFQRGRCLVPATGYYEWFDAGEGKEAYYAQDVQGQLLLMAGLYERSTAGVFGFVVVTQPSSGTATQYHERMPLLVPSELRTSWLEDRDPRVSLCGAGPELRWTQMNPNTE